jgi:hypothetical protein
MDFLGGCGWTQFIQEPFGHFPFLSWLELGDFFLDFG